jgi:hypothetical protein
MNVDSTWRELNHPCDSGGGCIMVDRAAGAFIIWDSKTPYGQRIPLTAEQYASFRRHVIRDSLPRAAGRTVAGVAGLRWPEPEACPLLVERVADAIIFRDERSPYCPLIFSKREYAEFRRRAVGGAWPRAAARAMAGLARVLLQRVALQVVIG